jgi:hypothetical protein
MNVRALRRIEVFQDKGAVARAREESRVEEGAEHGIAARRVEIQQTLRLACRQPHTGHLEELASNPSQQIVVACFGQFAPPFFPNATGVKQTRNIAASERLYVLHANLSACRFSDVGSGLVSRRRMFRKETYHDVGPPLGPFDRRCSIFVERPGL